MEDKNKVSHWDICTDFHGLNDFGHSSDGIGYSRSRTYSGECYREKKCHRKGRCVVAILDVPEAAKEK